ncbi:hypothetical protein BV25DRAFT_1799656 [Artomyces pyxidatus]|uniref:Uncharacterized protein n=1 Tax=Artomyces pyxidatus TaxID=48021 RepID=A0ACB8T8X8_9AGAM|nr:hypothetical protein BV25DRAFT_1799656 [Artomyces pyxidatus]
MPAKYSHVKKRAASGSARRTGSAPQPRPHSHDRAHPHKDHRNPDPLVDRSLTQAVSAVSQLERCIARILLLRYEQDIARLFSTHLYSVSIVHLPTLMMRCIALGGPGWVAHNADCDEIKDFFRAAIGMDLRQAGERVATKSVLWSYTVLRHFALSNDVKVCRRRGLQSLLLLPHYAALDAHRAALEALPAPQFAKPAHLPAAGEGLAALEAALSGAGADPAWRVKVRVGYERLVQTLWRVAHEFSARGYGLVLREKLANKWCECGCSTDHLGEVCERAVCQEEQEKGVRSGKQREWDGRGSGVYGWGTEEEEDTWESELDFGVNEVPDDPRSEMSVGELMEWRYFRAEKEKEQGNTAFKSGYYDLAIQHYVKAGEIEPEMPHYQLNLAAAHLKLSHWIEAEAACNKALTQHKSGKGYFRRARARRMQGHTEGAIQDLRAALRLQPTNAEALAELTSLVSPPATVALADGSAAPSLHRALADPPGSSTLSPAPMSSTWASAAEGPSSAAPPAQPDRLNLAKPKAPKPLPFARCSKDDRRLKVAALPLTLDVPVDMSVVSAKGRVPAYIEVKAETFSYPSWERYTVSATD